MSAFLSRDYSDWPLHKKPHILQGPASNTTYGSPRMPYSLRSTVISGCQRSSKLSQAPLRHRLEPSSLPVGALLATSLLPVDLHVATQVPGLGEPAATYLAVVRLLACVNSHVLGQRGGIGEATATDVALVRSLAAVGTHVRRNRRRLGKPLEMSGVLALLLAKLWIPERASSNVTE